MPRGRSMTKLSFGRRRVVITNGSVDADPWTFAAYPQQDARNNLNTAQGQPKTAQQLPNGANIGRRGLLKGPTEPKKGPRPPKLPSKTAQEELQEASRTSKMALVGAIWPFWGRLWLTLSSVQAISGLLLWISSIGPGDSVH